MIFFGIERSFVYLKMKALQIRLIQPGDNTFLAEIIRRVLAEFEAPAKGTAAEDSSLDRMYETYTVPGSAYFVLVEGSRVLGGCGFARLEGGDPDTCELQKMYLLEEARGRGAGRMLLEACLNYARENAYKGCYLETLPYMQKARELYLASGFVTLSARLGNTGHFSCDIWMYKEL